ncbi:MAG TPA: hypothetical protein VJ648_07360 [Vicinamibacteria bacterium]|nr:hypothetical protein [Vicinamibacteria bacterium]
MRRFLAALPALLSLAACAENPAGTPVPTGREFLLHAGESVAVEGTDFSVRFDVVASDSRCPADALCVTLGDAEAIFTVAPRRTRRRLLSEAGTAMFAHHRGRARGGSRPL